MTSLSWTLEQYPAFREIWRKVEPYTMTSPERGFALWQAVNHVIDNDIAGAFVECGVWKGGSSMLMALTLLERGVHRDLFLFDTFEGMTAPGDVDMDLRGTPASELLQGRHGDRIAELVAANISLDNVKQALESTGYDQKLAHYVVGDVRDTISKTQILRIALLRLDTDFYDSTFAELKLLYPRVSQGGTVIIDDYGHWQGARKAVDDYFSDPANAVAKPMLWALDYTGRGFIKYETHPRP